MPTQTEIVAAHTVDIQRFATELLRARIFPTLKQARIAAQRILLDYDEITGVTQLNAISAALRKELNPIFAEGWGGVNGELNQLAPVEAAFMASAIATANDLPPLKIPTDEQIQRFINRSIMSLTSGNRDVAGTWSELVNENTLSNIKTFDNQVKAGFSNGETVNQIARRLRTVEEGLLHNNAETLARTGVQHYAVQAREAMAQQNKSVIAREVPYVVFDNRTSLTCAGYSSRYGKSGWPVGESPIGYPPYHFNCRTSIIYLVNGQKEMEGERVSVGGKKGSAAKDKFEERQDRTGKKPKYRGRKDSEFNPKKIKASTNIDKWLMSQPKWFIESVFDGNKTKAKMFMSGKLSLSKFTDMTGSTLTIDQIIERNPRLLKDFS